MTSVKSSVLNYLEVSIEVCQCDAMTSTMCNRITSAMVLLSIKNGYEQTPGTISKHKGVNINSSAGLTFTVESVVIITAGTTVDGDFHCARSTVQTRI